WTSVLGQIQASPGPSELAVTFQTCCRSASYQPSEKVGLDWNTPWHRHLCVALEEHFMNLLAGSRNINRLSLFGNVPPSLTLRLARPYPGCGLSVKAVSSPIAEFIKETEEAWASWKEHRKTWPGLEWVRSRFSGDMECPTLCPTPHFVLV
ncbi:hypothetical protein N658DRAFT_549046, partial [Parathielavia hyrcaniae]